MASNPTTEQGEAEEEEEREGKATDTTVNATGTRSSQAGSDSAAQKGTPDPSQKSQKSTANLPEKSSLAPIEITSENELQETLENVSNRISTTSDKKSSGNSDNLSGSRQMARSMSSVRESMMRESLPTSNGADFPTKISLGVTTGLHQTDVSAPQSLPQTSSLEKINEASSNQASEREEKSENKEKRLNESSVVTKPALGASKLPGKGSKGPGETQAVSAPQTPSCFGSSRLFERRSPFVHNPPYPEERRPRILHPRCPRDYIINLREDLADFQESHGLPRTRDYSFLSLGLSLAQETGRAICAVFMMITELVPIIAIVSLILRFILDKLIEILETDGTVPRAKKSVIFVFQILIILIPLWILIGTIIIPLFYLVLSIFWKLFRLSGNRRSNRVVRERNCDLAINLFHSSLQGHKKGKQKTATTAPHHLHPTSVKTKK